MKLATVTPPAALAALQAVILIVLLLVAVAAFGPPAHGQELIREGCYGWLLSVPGSCGPGDALTQYRLCMIRDDDETCRWYWSAYMPVGRCLGIGAPFWERMVASEVEWRCVYADGRPPSEYVALGRPQLGVNNGRCGRYAPHP